LRDGCVPLDGAIACLESRPLEVSDCSRFGARMPVAGAAGRGLESVLLKGPATSYWVGISDREVEGQWRAFDGSMVERLPWQEHEPNDWGSGEDCAVYGPFGMPGKSLNDVNCHHSKSLVCLFSKHEVSTAVESGFPVYDIIPSLETLDSCIDSFRSTSDWRTGDRDLSAFVALGLQGLEITRTHDGKFHGRFHWINDDTLASDGGTHTLWEFNSKSLWSDSACTIDATDNHEVLISCGDARWTLVSVR